MSGPTRTKTSERKQKQQAEGSAQEPARRPVSPGLHSDILSLQRVAGNRAVSQLLQPGAESVPPVVAEVLKSGGGQPLDPSTREFMGSRFGRDFNQVRVHTDPRAAESADALDAAAYTVGQDLVFGVRQYQPETTLGKRLLAHELAHVVQQAQATREMDEIGQAGDQYERTADATARAVLHGVTTPAQPVSRVPALQRQQKTTVPPQEHELLRQDYISLAEEKIAEIDEALTKGYIWWEEEEFWSHQAQRQVSILEKRVALLRQIAHYLRELITDLQAGERYGWLRSTLLTRAGHDVLSPLRDLLIEKHGINSEQRLLQVGSRSFSIEFYVFFPSDKSTQVLDPVPPSGAALAPAATATPSVKEATPSLEKEATPMPGEGTPALPSGFVRRGRFPEPEHTNLYIRIPDPKGHPEGVAELLTPFEAAFRPAAELGSRNFALFRERGEGARFYYFNEGKKIYLPNLLEQFPKPPKSRGTTVVLPPR
jgi:hypothetical protein